MNQQAIEFYARKFFPHLQLRYGVPAVETILRSTLDPRPSTP
jgi:hypothetical protein